MQHVKDVDVSTAVPGVNCNVSLFDLWPFRGALPEAGDGDPGGAGLVSGPAGDPADETLGQRDGIQQGEVIQLSCVHTDH